MSRPSPRPAGLPACRRSHSAPTTAHPCRLRRSLPATQRTARHDLRAGAQPLRRTCSSVNQVQLRGKTGPGSKRDFPAPTCAAGEEPRTGGQRAGPRDLPAVGRQRLPDGGQLVTESDHQAWPQEHPTCRSVSGRLPRMYTGSGAQNWSFSRFAQSAPLPGAALICRIADIGSMHSYALVRIFRQSETISRPTSFPKPTRAERPLGAGGYAMLVCADTTRVPGLVVVRAAG
jgi:hypothetical protein